MITRKLIYDWIAANENKIYGPRTSILPIGVYFFQKSRSYNTNGFIESYQGVMNIMLHRHNEFQVVTSRTLKGFKGKTLILPDVKYFSTEEIGQLKDLIDNNVKMIFTGQTGIYDFNAKQQFESSIME